MEGIAMCCFVIEIWKYQLGLYLFFSQKIHRKWVSVFGFTLYIVCLVFGWIREEDMYLVMFGIVQVLLFFMIEANGERKIEEMLLMLFVITCLDSLFAEGVYGMLEWFEGELVAEKWDYFGGSVGTFALLFTVMVINEQKHIFEKEKVICFVRKGMVFLVVFMLLEIILTVTGLSFAKEHISNDKFKLFAGVVSATAYFALGCLGIFVIYIKHMNEKMEEVMKIEQALKEMQKNYYEALLKKETETRKYRHDITNHLICLYELAQEEHANKVAAYLEGMQEQAVFMNKRPIFTGNMVMDSLLNHYASMLSPDIELMVSGRADDNMRIVAADLCTVFANLLQNAVEEVAKIQDGRPYIHIQIQQGKEYLRIRVENSMKPRKNNMEWRRTGFIQTTKEDKKNHGIGIGNVEKTVKRYKGEFHVIQEQWRFIAEVVMRNQKAV